MSGVIVDSLTGRPVEAASFLVFRHKDSTLVKGAISDKEGKFEIARMPLDTFYAKVSSMGYKSRKRNKIILSSESPVLSLDTIRLSGREIYTPEVEIIAEKERLVYKEDKIILNVGKDLGNNAKEVLENSPLVEVDFNGNVSLMGSASTVIFIDGNPATMSGYEKLRDFRLLDAGEIERIELLTNPPIEFNIKPPTRVINIITKKIDYSRYNASIDANIKTRYRFDGDIGAAYGYKNLFVRSGYENSFSNIKYGYELQKNVNVNDEASFLQQVSNSKSISNENEFNFSAGKTGEKSMFTIQMSYSDPNSDNTTLLQNNFQENNKYTENHSTRHNQNKQRFFGLSTSYVNNIGKEYGTLRATIGFRNNTMNTMTDYNQTGSLYDGIDNSSVLQKNSSDNKNSSFSWEADYRYPLNKVQILADYKGSVKNLLMINSYSTFSYIEQKYNDDLSQKIEQKYLNIDHMFSGGIETFLWKMRLRGVLGLMTNTVENSDIIKGTGNKNNNVNMGGMVMAGIPLSGFQQLYARFSYEISNPSNRQLNPNIDKTDSTNITMGNPGLKPSGTSNFNLDYSLPIGSTYLTATLSYTNVNNPIERITVQKDGKTAVTTFFNNGGMNSYSASVNIGGDLFKRLSVWFGSSATEDVYKGIYAGNKNFSWGGSIHNKLNLNNLNFQLDFNYSSSSISVQEKSGKNYSVDAYVRFYTLDKYLSFVLMADDIFNSQNRSSAKYGNGFYAVKNKAEDTRIITFGISYYLQSKSKEDIPQMKTEVYGDDF
ncbi:MAG: outer membrane beta-barrel protein [Acidobacteriota bacterium]